MKYTAYILIGLLFLSSEKLFAQLLQSGPMVGYSSMREALLWAQTTAPATVHFEYWDKAAPQTRYKTEAYATKKAEAFTARLVADQLQPGKRYQYELFINNKKVPRTYPLEFQSQALWEYRTDPPAFKFAVGSCFHVNEEAADRPGRGYGGDYQIVEHIYKQQPDFMLWGGDNLYLREPDFDSRTGIHHRYTHTRKLPEMQPLLANTHHYAIWDDHEYGPNDSDGSYALKNLTEEAFRLFWGNPNYGPGTGGRGISGSFQWADVQFFMLDNRYFRTANNNYATDRKLLGDEQIDWLINALASSKATFKFIIVGCQVINPAQVFENYATYAEERQKLLSLIRKARIRGVFFLSGDRHHTELSMLKENNEVYPLYDLTASPLTSSAARSVDEPNTLRVPGTLVTERNFALMDITGPQKERVLKITIINSAGNALWTKEIAAKDLR